MAGFVLRSFMAVSSSMVSSTQARFCRTHVETAAFKFQLRLGHRLCGGAAAYRIRTHPSRLSVEGGYSRDGTIWRGPWSIVLTEDLRSHNPKDLDAALELNRCKAVVELQVRISVQGRQFLFTGFECNRSAINAES